MVGFLNVLFNISQCFVFQFLLYEIAFCQNMKGFGYVLFPPVIQSEAATELARALYGRGLERIYILPLSCVSNLFPAIFPAEAYPQHSILQSLCLERKKRWLPCAQPKHQLGFCKSAMDIMSSCCTSYKTNGVVG